MTNEIVSILIEIDENMDKIYKYIYDIFNIYRPLFSTKFKTLICLTMHQNYYYEIQNPEQYESDKISIHPFQIYKHIAFDTNEIISFNFYYYYNYTYTMTDIYMLNSRYNNNDVLKLIINVIFNYIQDPQKILYYINIDNINHEFIKKLFNYGFELKNISSNKLYKRDDILSFPTFIKLVYYINLESERCDVINLNYKLKKLYNFLSCYKNTIQIIQTLNINREILDTSEISKLLISLNSYNFDEIYIDKIKIKYPDELFYLRYNEKNDSTLLDYLDLDFTDKNILNVRLSNRKTKYILTYNNSNGHDKSLDCINFAYFFYNSLVSMKCIFNFIISFSGIYVINLSNVNNDNVIEMLFILLSMYMKFLERELKKININLLDVLIYRFSKLICDNYDIRNLNKNISDNLNNLIFNFDINYLKMFCDLFFKENSLHLYNLFMKMNKVSLLNINFIRWENIYNNEIININIPKYLSSGI